MVCRHTYCSIAFGDCGTLYGTATVAQAICPRGFTTYDLSDENDPYETSTFICRRLVPDIQPCPCDSGDGGTLPPGGTFGNPIDGEDGTKRQTETDCSDANHRLVFERMYRSDRGSFVTNYQTLFLPPTTTVFAATRTLPYASAYCDPAPTYQEQDTNQLVTAPPLCFPYTLAPGISAQITDPSGFVTQFVLNGSTGTPTKSSAVDSISQTATGWIWKRTREGLLEVYDTSGIMTERVSVAGDVLSMSYSDNNTSSSVAPGPGYLLSVSEEFGRSLSLTYDGAGRLSSMTDQAGLVTTYTYPDQNPGSQMTSVTYPDGASRQYVWNESANITSPASAVAPLLTGTIDESGNRYGTFTYNGGYATSSEHAGGADRYSLTSFSPFSSVTLTDPLGAQRSYSYASESGIAQPSTVSQPTCAGCGPASSSSTTYDSNGNPSVQRDFNGNITCYTNDTTRNLELVRLEGLAPGMTCPQALSSYQPVANTAQRLITTVWHPNWRLPISRAEPLKITTWVYNGQPDPTAGGVAASCAPAAAVLPDSEPIVVLCKQIEQATTDATGGNGFSASPQPGTTARVKQWTYNAYGQVLTSVDPLRNATAYSYYPSTSAGHTMGDLQSVTNALGQTTSFGQYTAAGLPLQSTDPNGTTTTYTYDLRQRLTSRSIEGETTGFSYYPTGLLQRLTLPDGSYRKYTYDAAHRLNQVADELGNSVNYTLDGMGNRTAVSTSDPSGTLSSTHSRIYNALDQLYQDIPSAGTAAVTTTFGYDSDGNQTSISAPLSRNTSNQYDALNRLTQITDPVNGVSTMSYDGHDNLISVMDPRSLVTSYMSDGLGNLSTLQSSDSGATTKTYDSGGNLLTSTDARGALSNFAYDALNRVASIAYSMGGVVDQTISFTYDAGTNGKGHLTGASDANHSLSWTYDALGRITSKAQTFDGITRAVGYAYTSGDLTALTTASGQTVAYGYNGNHQITSVSVNGAALLSGVSYEPFGGVSGWAWGNGTTEVRAFNEDGIVTTVSGGGETDSYTLDAANRITVDTNQSNASLSWSHGYDALDRLTTANSSPLQETFTFDADGNRLSQGGSYSSTLTISPTNNQVITTSGTPFGQLGYGTPSGTSGFLIQFAYDAMGRRIHKSSPYGNVQFVYDEAGHLLGEYGRLGKPHRRNGVFG